jgi:molybdopterin-binding protein
MQISARNQLKGTVRSVKLGTIMSEVLVEVGDQQIVAAITRGSAESLGLQEGSEVMVIIKATEVMIATGA